MTIMCHTTIKASHIFLVEILISTAGLSSHFSLVRLQIFERVGLGS